MYSKDCFSGFVFVLEDLAFVSSVLCFRCSHFSLFLLSSVRFLCVFSSLLLHFHVFSVPGGSLWSLVGRLDVLGSAWGALGAFLWALGTSLGMFRGSLGGRWESWSCSCEALGVTRASLRGSWGSFGHPCRLLGRPWQVLGRPCGRPSAPYAMHTDVSAFRIILS